MATRSRPIKHQLKEIPTITDSRPPKKVKSDDCNLSMLVTCPRTIGDWPKVNNAIATAFATTVPKTYSLYAAESFDSHNCNQCNPSPHEAYMNLQQPERDLDMSIYWPCQEVMQQQTVAEESATATVITPDNVLHVSSETTPNGPATVYFRELNSFLFFSNDKDTLWSFPTALVTVAAEPSTDATVPDFKVADTEAA
ncbi:fork head domain-containing protein [Colletotrichum tabaci]|uniref:Fork head domain-containing protein n=1 Tax=Colletotrichum tabaci TaxID=1209068 RepID=A0AAV9SUB7_9PEZI